jgi:dipeptidyl aminopeptidase/acylaminoacyl peptidase
MPDYYREACLNIDELKKEIELYPNSIGEIMGYTYKWWNGFMNYKPYNYYENINIPILFIHGNLDIMIPVESTKYIQNNLLNKPFDYIYIDDANHYYNTSKSKEIFENNIIKWVKDHL